jgi:hypothetical protein
MAIPGPIKFDGESNGALIIAKNVDTYLKLLGLHTLAYLD